MDKKNNIQIDYVPASNFSKISNSSQTKLLKSGFVPVNDIFLPVLKNDAKITLLYGSYGSGKSVFIADWLITECLHQKYFRCFYGRAVYRTIRESVFQTLIDRIEERGLQKYFSYSTADNSSMAIRCYNGNSFIPFGCDDSEKIKSIKDPTHIFVEEIDQIKETDFSILLSRLRTEKAKTKFIGAFNTVVVRPSHWIKKAFFQETNTAYGDIKINKVFCNHVDNWFIDKKKYRDILWIASGQNSEIFEQIANGKWAKSLKGVIYPEWQEYSKVPAGAKKVYGLDFGFTHPTALVEVNRFEDAIYCRELIYEKKLTPKLLITRMEKLNIGNDAIYCDGSRPELIEMLYRKGYNVHKANKDVILGISHVNSKKIYLHKMSGNLKREISGYRFDVDKEGITLERPIKINDDGMDAIRYGEYSDETRIKHIFKDADY